MSYQLDDSSTRIRIPSFAKLDAPLQRLAVRAASRGRSWSRGCCEYRWGIRREILSGDTLDGLRLMTGREMGIALDHLAVLPAAELLYRSTAISDHRQAARKGVA